MEGIVALDPLNALEHREKQFIILHFKHMITNSRSLAVSKHEDLVGRNKLRFLSMVFAFLPVVWAVELECKKVHSLNQDRKVIRGHCSASWCL